MKKPDSISQLRGALFVLLLLLAGHASAQVPTAISGPVFLCPGDQAYYIVTNLPGGCTQFTWSVAGGTINGTGTASVFVTAGGSGWVSVSCTADCFGTLYAGSQIIAPPATPSITKSSTHYEVCSGESWTLTCNSALGTSYGYDWYVSYSAPAGGSGVLLNGGSYTLASYLHTATNTVTLTAPAGYGTFTVRARLRSTAPTPPSCPSLWGGLIGQAGIYNSSQFYPVGPGSLCANSTASYSSSYYGSDITSTQWGWASSFNYQGGQGSNFLYVGTPSPFYGGAILLRLGNRCGLTNTPSVLNVGHGSCFRVASPNPVSTSIELTLTDPVGDEPVADNLLVNARLINMNNQVVWSGELNGRKNKIDVSQVVEGWYILKVSNGDQTTNERILVKH